MKVRIFKAYIQESDVKCQFFWHKSEVFLVWWWWSLLNKFSFAVFILTIKVIERRPNKMRMRLIIFRFLSTIFWFILSSLTPATLSGSLLPSYSVSSSSLKWNLWSLFNNLLNLRVFLFYRDSALPRMEWFWSPSLGSNNGSVIVTFGRVSASSMMCSHKIEILLESFWNRPQFDINWPYAIIFGAAEYYWLNFLQEAVSCFAPSRTWSVDLRLEIINQSLLLIINYKLTRFKQT